MSLVIKIIGEELGVDFYIMDFDLDSLTLETTSDKTEAKQFPDMVSAIEFWKQQSKILPFRPDGKPNRPLTAFTITFEQVDQ